MSAAGHRGPTVEDLVYWRNPAASGVVLGAATVLYVLLEWSGTPLLAWLSNVLLIGVLGTLIWAQAAKLVGRPSPAEVLPAAFTTGVDEAQWRIMSDKVRQAANVGLASSGRVLSGSEPLLSLKAAGVIFLVGWAGRLMSPVALLYTATLLAFILPKAYESNKAEVDARLDNLRSVAGEQYGKLSAQATEIVNRITPRKAPQPKHE